MATIGQIKNQIEFYLQTTEFSQDGQDILLDELNEARKDAERFHDFQISLQRTTLAVDPDTGGDLTSVTLAGGKTFKALQLAYLVGSYGDIPLHTSSKRVITQEKRDELDSWVWNYMSEFRAMNETDRSVQGMPRVYMLGTTVYLDPKPTEVKTLALDVFTWWPDYTDDADTDWFTENGSNYLKWAAIVALNHKTGTFAPRQEGVLPPPEKMKNEALAKLISMDSWSTQHGRSPMM